ncbi:2854_t:CDS:2, partial [Dentiscutata erythropus]
MKPLEILPLFFIVGFAIVCADNTPICWDHLNPLKPSERKRVSCYSTTNTNSNDLSFTKRDESDMFNVTFTCLVNNQTLCNKVKNAFDSAGQIIAAAIAFKTPVTVNATFTNFCSVSKQCSLTSGTLGGASPARSIQITDDDGVQRLFPQSLVKQKNFTGINHSMYSDFDIFAIFNSQAGYWFEGDGEMKNSQSDFLFVILHELIHGLGFTSGYDDFINVSPQALTPQIFSEGTGDIIFSGFVEMVFDKCMAILPSGQRISNITKQLNTTFLLPPKSTDISNATILETTLNPYSFGSSVCHFDYKTYNRTSDFLMRYLQERGLTLRQFIYLGGNYPYGPIGPKLR